MMANSKMNARTLHLTFRLKQARLAQCVSHSKLIVHAAAPQAPLQDIVPCTAKLLYKTLRQAAPCCFKVKRYSGGWYINRPEISQGFWHARLESKPSLLPSQTLAAALYLVASALQTEDR